ncbi:hypothetical protein [Streptomyces europaeiscabiei]|uniref:hypothetical protein n=1 Tax=Streptomyces europaeiscabiei TaxID=146819 RepID=UPI002E0E7755|nr:hypothetical protein OHB30_05285 [Streptomyces europaeiscabiei]
MRPTCNAARTGTGAKAAWSWLRDGTVISGATGRTRTPTASDYEHGLSCRATVTNNAGSTRSTSAAVTVAVGPALKADKGHKVSVKVTAKRSGLDERFGDDARGHGALRAPPFTPSSAPYNPLCTKGVVRASDSQTGALRCTDAP